MKAILFIVFAFCGISAIYSQNTANQVFSTDMQLIKLNNPYVIDNPDRKVFPFTLSFQKVDSLKNNKYSVKPNGNLTPIYTNQKASPIAEPKKR